MKKKYSYWLDSGKYSMLQKLVMVLFGLLTFMLLARVFGDPEKFGIWGLFIVISSIVEMMRHALVKNGYILFINTCEDRDRPGFEFAALLSNVIFTVILVVFFFLTGDLFERAFHSKGMGIILKYYSITLIFLLAFSHREFFLIARMDFKGMFFMYLIRNGVFLLVVSYLFFAKASISPEVLAIYYGLSAVAGVMIGMVLGEKYSRLRMKWDKRIFIQFLNYGKFILGTNFFALVFRNTDSFIVARFISPAAVAFYNTSTRIINFAEMPVLVLSETMLPKAAQIIKTGDLSGMKNIYEKTVAAMLTLIIPFIIVASFFSKQIILIIAGPEYLQAVPILNIMVLYCFFIPFTSQFGNTMDSTGRARTNFIVNFIFALFNVASNFFFIHYFGLIGSAYGTLLSYFILFLTTQILLSKLIGVSVLQIIKNIFELYPEYLGIAKRYITKSLSSR